MVMTSGTDGARKVTTILGTEEGYSCRKTSPRLLQEITMTAGLKQ